MMDLALIAFCTAASAAFFYAGHRGRMNKYLSQNKK
jgi:hypothetical protein